MVYRLQLLGFNAVRLPFSFVDLYDTPAQVPDALLPPGAPHDCDSVL